MISENPNDKPPRKRSRLSEQRQHEAELAAVSAAAAATAVRQQQALEDLQTIDASQLGKLLGRSTKMIKIDCTKRPSALPPRFIVSGVRKLRWRVIDVREWMDALAEIEADRRQAELAFARSRDIKKVPRRTFDLADQDRGELATKRMLEKRANEAKS